MSTRAASKRKLGEITSKKSNKSTTSSNMTLVIDRTAAAEASEMGDCPDIDFTYLCNHTWNEHVYACRTKAIARCPTVIPRPLFACMFCSPPGASEVTQETMLKAKTLGPEFEAFVQGLIKQRNDALVKVTNENEASKVNEEIEELKAKLKETQKESEMKGTALDDLKKQVEAFYARNGVPAIQTIANAAQSTSNGTQGSPTTSMSISSVLNNIVVVELYEKCGHKIVIFGSAQGATLEGDSAVGSEEAVVLKKNHCAKCLKFMTSSEREKIRECAKRVQENFDHMFDTFDTKFRVETEDVAESSGKSKAIVGKFFASAIQNTVEELDDGFTELVDWFYGVQVSDNITAMELALRQGDEAEFLRKFNEIEENKKELRRELKKTSVTLGEKVVKACEGSVEKWLVENQAAAGQGGEDTEML
ncbi:uncharacterized protein LY89DRAFT_740397 [Mollisia scopiformis]|uniref:Uncharacterized protein n=1 Tax=Mollisia scopiformis TaxID=149040 RepID=A0A132BC70_MOLSC|nr:uncharacterized protein LY89DRAFT_740397 [Mollisia scopiformis]KUJ09986.1 hypothetical protein LY89DRAFT_740397 [Mollisia scopiformis]